jgi:hypothetical protein
MSVLIFFFFVFFFSSIFQSDAQQHSSRVGGKM